jgi:hypothetical protein
MSNQDHLRSNMSYPLHAQQTETTPLAYSYIRFSTQDQLEDDSQRRQLELPMTYYKQNNLKLKGLFSTINEKRVITSLLLPF